jgi:hypothetical protein
MQARARRSHRHVRIGSARVALARRRLRRSARRARGWGVGLALLAGGGLGACETTPPTVYAPPSEAARAAMRELTLEVAEDVAAVPPRKPSGDGGDAAAHGAGEGAAGALLAGLSGCVEPLSCIISLGLGVAIAPFAAAGGAIAGAASGHDADDIAGAEVAIQQKLAETQFATMLGERLAQPEKLPPGYRMELAAVSAAGGGEGDGAAAADAPSGARLLLEVMQLGFAAVGDYDPELWLRATVRARLFAGSDPEAEPLFWRSWEYRGRGQDYVELGENGAALLGAEFDRAAIRLAERIRQDLFFATQPERVRADRGEEDAVRTVGGPLAVTKPTAAPASLPPAEAAEDRPQPNRMMPPAFENWRGML